MQYLRQSTASQEISLGFFLDSTDGDTAETGLTIANTDIGIRKGGTTTIVNKNSGGATHIASGIYSAVLDATDTNTIGMLEVYCHVAGALANKERYMVLHQASYDALLTNGLNDIPATDVVSNGAITTLTGSVVSVDVVATTTVNTDMRGTNAADIPDAVWDELKAGHVTANTFGAFLDVLVSSRASSGALTTVNNTVDAILIDTDTTIPAIIGALNDFDPTTDAVANVTLVATTTTNTDMVGTNGANTVTPPTAAANADAVWDEVQSGHTTAGTFGLFLDQAISSVAAGSGLTAQQTRDAMKLAPSVGAPIADSIDDKLDNQPTTTEFEARTVLSAEYLQPTVSGRTLDITVGGAAGINWGNVENQAASVTLGTTTVGLVNTITTYTGNTLQTGDSFVRLGAPVGASISADIADIPIISEFEARTLPTLDYFNPVTDVVANVTLVATTTANTDMRGTDNAFLGGTYVAPDNAGITANGAAIAALNDFNPVTEAVANVTLVATTTVNSDMVGTNNAFLAANYTAPDNSGIVANGVAIAALNNLSTVQVNAEMVDVLFTDTYAETTAPSSTASIASKIGWIFSLSKNRITMTNATHTLRNNTNTGDLGTASVSDDTVTFVRGRFS